VGTRRERKSDRDESREKKLKRFHGLAWFIADQAATNQATPAAGKRMHRIEIFSRGHPNPRSERNQSDFL
jgi:hypothetical protein